MSFLRGTSAVSYPKTRLSTIREVEEDITASSLLWGHGLGIGVPSRPQEMEITFLEIFHKEGLIGVSVWTSLLIGIFWHYASLRRPDQASRNAFLSRGPDHLDRYVYESNTE